MISTLTNIAKVARRLLRLRGLIDRAAFSKKIAQLKWDACNKFNGVRILLLLLILHHATPQLSHPIRDDREEE